MERNVYNEIALTIGNEQVVLLADKALYLPQYDTLLLADLHFGKVEHFRKNGFAIPGNVSQQDLARLKKLILNTKAQKIVFLGDLFHSDLNDAWFDFQSLLKELNTFQFHLVIGNHDILDVREYQNLHIHHQMEVGDFVCTHEPLEVIVEGKYNLCGHIHPAVRLRGKGRQSLRMPCFYFGPHTGILPSFGSFTGLHVVKPMEGDRVFVVNHEMVMEVN